MDGEKWASGPCCCQHCTSLPMRHCIRRSLTTDLKACNMHSMHFVLYYSEASAVPSHMIAYCCNTQLQLCTILIMFPFQSRREGVRGVHRSPGPRWSTWSKGPPGPRHSVNWPVKLAQPTYICPGARTGSRRPWLLASAAWTPFLSGSAFKLNCWIGQQ